MSTVSDELVERVGRAIDNNTASGLDDWESRAAAIAAIRLLLTPDIVLAEAERLLRDKRIKTIILDGPPNDSENYVELWSDYPNEAGKGLVATCDVPGQPLSLGAAYQTVEVARVNSK